MKGIALLARVCSHLSDARRRALWQDRLEDYTFYSDALHVVERHTRNLREQRVQELRQKKAAAAAAQTEQRIAEEKLRMAEILAPAA